MTSDIRLHISRSSLLTRSSEHLSRPEIEEYLSNDGSCLLQLQWDSEIRFGPAYYKAAIYSGGGKLALDLGARRFFSYDGYGQDYSKWTGPWSPTSSCVALVELLTTQAAPGTKIARLNIVDVSRRTALVAWDLESLVTHKMWSSDGRFYLFRDVYTIYSCSIENRNLVPLSTSKSPHCFLLKDEFVCVIENNGAVFVFEAISGTLVASDLITEAGYVVKDAFVDGKPNNISVILKCQTEPDAEDLCYSITVRAGAI